MGVKGPGLEPASGRYSLHTSFIPPQRADRDRGRQTLRTLHCAAAGDGLLSWEWNCSQLYDWSIVLNTRRWHSTVNWRHFNNNVFLKKKKKSAGQSTFQENTWQSTQCQKGMWKSSIPISLSKTLWKLDPFHLEEGISCTMHYGATSCLKCLLL